MRSARSSIYRLVISVSPALLILILTVIISLVTGHPRGVFLSRSIGSMLVRFSLVTLIFIAPVFILPNLLTQLMKIGKNEGAFGQFVRAACPYQELSKANAWIIRPLQGIGLSMIFAERIVNFLEFLPVRLVLFFMVGALVSLFLSIVWAMDDLGVKIYNRRTGEVYMAGRSIGIVLPLITGAIGISGLFHLSTPLGALIDLLEIIMVLYPSYVFLVIFHREFIKMRLDSFAGRLILKRIDLELR